MMTDYLTICEEETGNTPQHYDETHNGKPKFQPPDVVQ
jgi:hypothetical protein